jgi:hypothetical protein
MILSGCRFTLWCNVRGINKFLTTDLFFQIMVIQQTVVIIAKRSDVNFFVQYKKKSLYPACAYNRFHISKCYILNYRIYFPRRPLWEKIIFLARSMTVKWFRQGLHLITYKMLRDKARFVLPLSHIIHVSWITSVS